MDEDNTSASVAPEATETPAEDPILSTLADTEDTSTEESSTVETPKEEEVVETADEEDTEAETPPEGEAEDEESEEEGQPIDPKEEARRRYEERQRVIREREARVQQQTQEYVAEGEDEYDQRLRSMEVQQYSNLIANNEQTLINEFERVKANPDLQIFNPENPEAFNEKAYDKAIRDFNAGYISYDTNGNMVGIRGSLFEHLTETADLLQGAIKSGAVAQVRAAKKVKNSADPKPAATPKEPAKDPILDVLSGD